jgi:hypothetical protein
MPRILMWEWRYRSTFSWPDTAFQDFSSVTESECGDHSRIHFKQEYWFVFLKWRQNSSLISVITTGLATLRSALASLKTRINWKSRSKSPQRRNVRQNNRVRPWELRTRSNIMTYFPVLRTEGTGSFDKNLASFFKTYGQLIFNAIWR